MKDTDNHAMSNFQRFENRSSQSGMGQSAEKPRSMEDTQAFIPVKPGGFVRMLPHTAFVPQRQIWQEKTVPIEALTLSKPRPGNSPDAKGSAGVVRRHRKALVVGALVGLVLLLGGSAFALLQVAKAAQGATLYQVNMQDFGQDIGGGGIVFPRQQALISYPLTERIVAVLVKPGDHVNLNQALIQLDPRQLNAQIRQAADALAAADTYLKSVTAGGNAVAIAHARQQYDLAKSKYHALLDATSSPLLHNGRLVAPLAGVVTAVNVDASETFKANAPLLTIMDESSVIVHAKIPLADLGQLHVGQRAQVFPSAFPDLSLAGSVVSLVPQADPQSETFEVWVEVQNTLGRLLPGMRAFVRIQASARALSVPRMAVLDLTATPQVFVVLTQHVYLRSLHVVGRTAERVFVDRGLSAGDMIVLLGLDRLQNGQAIHIARIEQA